MKKPIAIILAAIMMFALCACGNTATDSSDSGPTYVFTFGTVDTDEHPSTMSAKKLGEILNEKAPGKWQINVHPNSTLGGAAELVESIQMGNVDMACPATSFLANYVPSIGVLDLPYMFTNTSEAYAVLDGDVGQQLAADVEAVGIKCLSYWEVGFRCIANSARPINSVEDVSGLRLRIMSNEIHQALFSALGVDPVPMGLADALVANQQGTIDGMDNPIRIMVDANCAYDVSKAKRILFDTADADLYWFEEPISPENRTGYAELKNLTKTYLAAGEQEYSKYHYKEWLEARSVDILQPDLCVMGGFTEGKKVLALAQAYMIQLVPHMWGTGIGVAAGLQFIANIPATPLALFPDEPMIEYDLSENLLRDTLIGKTIKIENGTVKIPHGSGLGIKVDRNVIERFLMK